MASAEPSVDVEGDLAELQKKYRVIDGDRKAYSEDNQAVLRKQRCRGSPCKLTAWSVHPSPGRSRRPSLLISPVRPPVVRAPLPAPQRDHREAQG